MNYERNFDSEFHFDFYAETLNVDFDLDFETFWNFDFDFDTFNLMLYMLFDFTSEMWKRCNVEVAVSELKFQNQSKCQRQVKAWKFASQSKSN